MSTPQYLIINPQVFTKSLNSKLSSINASHIYLVCYKHSLSSLKVSPSGDSDWSDTYEGNLRFNDFFKDHTNKANIGFLAIPLGDPSAEKLATINSEFQLEMKAKHIFITSLPLPSLGTQDLDAITRHFLKIKGSGGSLESLLDTPPEPTALEKAVIEVVSQEIKNCLNSNFSLEKEVQNALDSIKNDVIKKHLKVDLVVNSKQVEGVVHEQLEHVLKLISTKEPLFLYGPAGSGKTSLAVKSAEVLGLPHYSISVNEQTTKTDFLGYFDAHSVIIKTNFRKAYESGGVFIIDEIDAGNPNVLTVLNSALANGFMAFPDGNIERHDKFICVCTANTTGNEASVQYIGRNILDAATLDRFVRYYIGYSSQLESKILSPEALRVRDLVRQYYSDQGSDEFLSTRSLLQYDKLLAVGFEPSAALNLACKPDETVLNLCFE